LAWRDMPGRERARARLLRMLPIAFDILQIVDNVGG